MIRVGIVGISGYSGVTTLELLLKHPGVRVTYVSAETTTGKVSEIWPHLNTKTDLVCHKFKIDEAITKADLFFLAVPHTVAMKIAPKLLAAKKKVIDLSADYRLKKGADYKKWYNVEHTDTSHLTTAVYGLPEIYREKIKKAQLVANPGCYPTAALLALAPLVSTQTEDIQSIIIDAKSGVTGAGRKVTLGFMFAAVSENFKAYKVLNHQHTPEINQYLSAMANKNWEVTFIPHLLPINRGILETIYVSLKKELLISTLHKFYTRFYKTEQFIRILPVGQQPEIKNVTGTNYCDIALAVDKRMLVITAAIDNLLKGAAGQAVQNMNIMCGFKEEEALL